MRAKTVRTVCFLSARNLGDAVIHADFLKALVASRYASRYIIWTFPQAAFLFEGIKQCDVVCSDFPMGATIQSFIRGGFRSFWAAVRRIRSEHPTETLELVSDIRERLVCRLLGAGRNLFPAWEVGHPFRSYSRMGRFQQAALVTIPKTVTSLYAAYDMVLSVLIGSGHAPFSPKINWPLLSICAPSEWHGQLGIHPFASVPFKLWPEHHWLSFLNALRVTYPNTRVVLFGSPADRGNLESLARRAGGGIEIFAASLGEFKARLLGVDLLIGLDSFSVHLAQSQGVPALILVGPSDPRLFNPPGAKSIACLGSCIHQPCGGRPKCIGTSFQYACMSSITPTQVLEEIPSKANLWC